MQESGGQTPRTNCVRREPRRTGVREEGRYCLQLESSSRTRPSGVFFRNLVLWLTRFGNERVPVQSCRTLSSGRMFCQKLPLVARSTQVRKNSPLCFAPPLWCHRSPPTPVEYAGGLLGDLQLVPTAPAQLSPEDLKHLQEQAQKVCCILMD